MALAHGLKNQPLKGCSYEGHELKSLPRLGNQNQIHHILKIVLRSHLQSRHALRKDPCLLVCQHL